MAAGETHTAAAPAPRAPIAGPGEDLLRRSATLIAAAARVRAGNDDAAVHDLRVAARRLEMALRVWRPPAGEPGASAARRARGAAGRLRRAAGRARELEVHVALLEERAAPGAADDRPALLRLVSGLRAQRDRARVEVAEFARARRLERVADRVAVVVLALAATPDRIAAAERRVGGTREAAAEALLTAADTTDDGPLHAARIALKKWRYAEESRAAVPSTGPAPRLGEMREAQRALGSIHDHATLRELLRRRAKRAARAGEQARSQALASLLPRLDRARLALLPGLPARLRALARAAKR